MTSKLLLVLRGQCLCFIFGGLFSISSVFLFFSFQTNIGVGLIMSPHTHILFLFISIQCVPLPEYAIKLRGHWFLLNFIIWCTEAEREREGQREREKAKEGSCSSCCLLFPLSKDAVAFCPCQAGRRWEKRKWLPFTLEPELIRLFSSHFLSPCTSVFVFYLKWRLGSCEKDYAMFSIADKW